jgi:methionine synthase I (cobalamin-dependent)
MIPQCSLWSRHSAEINLLKTNRNLLHIRNQVKMADEVSDQIEDPLNLIVSTTEQSGNMNKGLKKSIFETVSTLRNLFVNLRVSRFSKTTEISKLEWKSPR